MIPRTSQFLARGQQSMASYVGWLEELENDIASQLARIIERCRIALSADDLVLGFTGVEWAPNSRTAWIMPMGEPLEELFIAGIALAPDETTTFAIAFEVGNSTMIDLCTRHGFSQTNAETLMTIRSDEFVRPVALGTDGFDVRPYFPDAREALIEIHPTGAHFSIDDFVAELDDRHYLFTIWDGERCIGMCDANRDQAGTTGNIENVMIQADHRRRGAGRRIVTAALETLFADGADHVELTVRVTNDPARSLYRSIGFRALQTVAAYKAPRAVARQTGSG
jgi:ribosomal protein S18 acetylase RimI-like enzyme